jgi:hypothetical protein
MALTQGRCIAEPTACHCLATLTRRLAGVSRELKVKWALVIAVFPNHSAVTPIQARRVAAGGDQSHQALRGETKKRLDADSLLGGNPLPLRGLKERRSRGGSDKWGAQKALTLLVGVQSVARGRGRKSSPCMVTLASLRQSSSTLAVVLAALDLAEEIRRSCFFTRFVSLQATAASFLSLAAFCSVSFASLHLAAISVLVEAWTPA